MFINIILLIILCNGLVALLIPMICISNIFIDSCIECYKLIVKNRNIKNNKER